MFDDETLVKQYHKDCRGYAFTPRYVTVWVNRHRKNWGYPAYRLLAHPREAYSAKPAEIKFYEVWLQIKLGNTNPDALRAM